MTGDASTIGWRAPSGDMWVLTCLPGGRPIHQRCHIAEQILGEVRKRRRKRFVLERLARGNRVPRLLTLAIPDAEQLMLDVAVDAVDHPVGVQVAMGAAVRD